jgi:2-phosphoglycolate phosphatase
MLSHAPVQAALFDLDGTLVHTAPDLVGTLNTLLREDGRAELDITAIAHEVSNGSPGLIRAGFGLRMNDPGFVEIKARFLAHYADNLSNESRLYPAIDELIRSLDARQVPWGIVTNKPAVMARALIRALGLRPQALLGGDSSPRPKPAADALELACAHLRVSPGRCIYVGDAPRDIEAGRSAGMRTISAAFGYLPPGTDVQHWNADHVAKQPQDIWSLIEPYLAQPPLETVSS